MQFFLLQLPDAWDDLIFLYLFYLDDMMIRRCNLNFFTVTSREKEVSYYFLDLVDLVDIAVIFQ